ncbi:MAG: lactate racemase domain-containing protein [Bacteroidetes bacterium]|nr:lactate racemase domain-containing protein [Bacteroidota bacterium]
MIYYQGGAANLVLSKDELKTALFQALDKLGPKHKVLIIPPDFTRYHSQAGILTEMAWEYYGESVTDILPALGTHVAMTGRELNAMFGKVPHSLFREHNWRNDIVTLGQVPAEFVRQVSENKVNFTWPAQVNKLVASGDFDLILSIGQVVPHEVIGMANYNKNIFVGTGGRDGINKSHFLGAAYGMERIMGKADNPVRQVLNYAAEHFASHLPIVYVHTVVSRSADGILGVNGLFIGNDHACFTNAASLSMEVNFERVEEPLTKVVVYLDPEEFKSTWLGNKSIYRTRMAIADGGELIVLGPGIHTFGEDREIDHLIRKYGYRSTPEILKLVAENIDLSGNLSAAAHLIHGSSENRFTITYCPGYLSRMEIEEVNFRYADLEPMTRKYDPAKLKEGYNQVGDERIFFISNPALGLWAHSSRLIQL